MAQNNTENHDLGWKKFKFKSKVVFPALKAPMDSADEQLQLDLDRISIESRQASSFDDLIELTNNSERLMARVNSSLDDLNTALDNLEARTERVLVEIRRLISSEMPAQGPHDGCGDPDARA